MKKTAEISQSVQIKAPNLQTAVFAIEGTAPLVIKRFSEKAKEQIRNTMAEGSTPKKVKNRDPVDFESVFNQSRYISPEGWDGFNVASIRAAMISACRLVNFKMTMAK